MIYVLLGYVLFCVIISLTATYYKGLFWKDRGFNKKLERQRFVFSVIFSPVYVPYSIVTFWQDIGPISAHDDDRRSNILTCGGFDGLVIGMIGGLTLSAIRIFTGYPSFLPIESNLFEFILMVVLGTVGAVIILILIPWFTHVYFTFIPEEL